MVDDLIDKGDLAVQWQVGFCSVPRHAFIPETVWRVDEDTEDVNDLIPLHRSEHPDTWLELAYADDAVITQVDDCHPVGPGLIGHEITSSASMPTVVAIMLAALGVEPGMTVCEVGTGTGYNAALFATRLGAANVTTIEVDPQIATRARTALADAGHGEVTVVTGDGAQGHPPGAPYDRVISTASVQRVPYPWVAQTRPGGRVVTPWGTAYYNGGLLSLTVAEDGTAQGNIVDKASFMDLRDQRIPRVSVSRCVRGATRGVEPVMTASVSHPELRTELLHRSEVDQEARLAYLDAADRGDDVDWAPVQAVDDDNLGFLITVIGRHGWPGSDLVAEDGAHAEWLLVQHAPPAYQSGSGRSPTPPISTPDERKWASHPSMRTRSPLRGGPTNWGTASVEVYFLAMQCGHDDRQRARESIGVLWVPYVTHGAARSLGVRSARCVWRTRPPSRVCSLPSVCQLGWVTRAFVELA